MEEQFYLVWPLLIVGIGLLALRRGWAAPRRRTALVVTVALVCVASFVWCVFETAHQQPFAFFGTPARAWQLCLGALVAIALADRRLSRGMRAGLGVVGLILYAAALLWLDEAGAGSLRYPGWLALVPTLAAVALIAGGGGQGGDRTFLDRALSVQPLQRIGDLSYSWYLWHWPVLVLLPLALGRHPAHALVIDRPGQITDLVGDLRVGDRPGRDGSVGARPFAVGPRGDLTALLTQDPADRLDHVALGPQLVDESDDQRLRGRVPRDPTCHLIVQQSRRSSWGLAESTAGRGVDGASATGPVRRSILLSVNDQADSQLATYLHMADALYDAMTDAVAATDSRDAWRFASYKTFMRKYNDLLTWVTNIEEVQPPVDTYNLDNVPSNMNTIGMQQQEFFEDVRANLAILRAHLRNRVNPKVDQIVGIADFLEANLRRAVLELPEKEKDVQDVVEQLLIGRGMDKGLHYDRESGRVKVSAKEVVPDFVLVQLNTAIEVKLAKDKARVGPAIDEINADIQAYGKIYDAIVFVIYDTGGSIRDDSEFKRDLEANDGVRVLVVKH